MKFLTTGKGTSGSWKCRGEQLGGSVGKVKPHATIKDFIAADIVMAVKRLTPHFHRDIISSEKPWIWDLVDFYPQPNCSAWSRDYAIHWVRKQIQATNPNGIIYPNREMRDDIGIDGTVIYHHARENAPLNPIREKVRVVGYDGGHQYLGKWSKAIQKECNRRGWEFLTNIPLHEMDIVVAFRDHPHNGYVQQHWKSNVKLANAHATGTPFIGQAENGYIETSTNREFFINDEQSLSVAFDYLESYETRKAISELFKQNTITLDSVSKELIKYGRDIQKRR